MCGLAGVYVTDKGYDREAVRIGHLIDELLLGVDHRGGDATGLVAAGGNAERPVRIVAACDAKEYVSGRPRIIPDGARYVIGHTRFATQGHQGWNENNHPVQVGGTYLTHNGHITNEAELWRRSELECGHGGTVDTLALCALIERVGLDNAPKEAFPVVRGAAAIAVCNPTTHPDDVILARISQNPLFVYAKNGVIVWASTQAAIREAWRKVYGGKPALDKVKSLRIGQAVRLTSTGPKLVEFTAPPETSGGWVWAGSSWSSGAATKQDTTPEPTTRDATVSEAKAATGVRWKWFSYPSTSPGRWEAQCAGCNTYTAPAFLTVFGEDDPLVFCDRCTLWAEHAGLISRTDPGVPLVVPDVLAEHADWASAGSGG